MPLHSLHSRAALAIVLTLCAGGCGTSAPPADVVADSAPGPDSSPLDASGDGAHADDASPNDAPGRDATGDSAASPDLSKLTPTCFPSAGVVPQLTKGSLFSGADWNDPSVLRVGGQYVMYASSDHDFDVAVSIYRLVSTDGRNWAPSPSGPVLAPSPGSTDWDHRSVETPSVVFFKGAYHLFYTGYPVVYTDISSYRIGHAVSSDGIAWTRDAAPLLAPTCPGWTPTNQVCSAGGAPTDPSSFLVGEPGAVVFQDRLYVYFTELGYDAALASPLQTIGLITSTDGSTWSKPQRVLAPDQTIYPRATWLGYSTPSAIVLGGQVHPPLDAVRESPWQQVALHHARSSDGVTAFVQDPAALLESSSFAWTAREIRAPSALLDGATLRLWFAGDTGGTSPSLGIGESDCPL